MAKFKVFMKGLGFAVVSSVAGAGIDAVHQQIATGTIDIPKLYPIAVSAAIVGVLGYLKQSPLGKSTVEPPTPPDAK